MELIDAANIFLRYKEQPVSQNIHPNDMMYNHGKSHYYTIGESAIRVILSGLQLAWRQKVNRILDLPCGHGRVARHLRHAFPKSELFFCDLDHEGVEFCSEAFDGTGIPSKTDLLDVSLPHDLDVIWVGSLFTHVDLARTEAWLHYLAGHLHDHGVLIATFHGLFTKDFTKTPSGGVNWEKIVEGFEISGYGYDDYQTFDMGNYGTSLSKPSKIVDIATSIEGIRILAYTERGWANNQDVLILTKNDRRHLYTGK